MHNFNIKWRRHVYASTVYISCLFGSKPEKGVGIQNGRYSRFAGHKLHNTEELS